VTVRVLTSGDFSPWRAIRLEALQRLPENFLTTYDEEYAKPETEIAEMLDQGRVLGLFRRGELAAVLSVDPERRSALAHRAWINAFYVRPDWQGTDAAHQLMQVAIAHAKSGGFVQLELYVAVDNTHAIRFYERAGFVRHGRMPRSVRLPDRYQDDFHYVLEIDD
jgi:GNAT superfamily N-acetyltransferase